MNIYPIQKYNQKNKYTFILLLKSKVLREKQLHGEAFFNSLLFTRLKHKTQIWSYYITKWEAQANQNIWEIEI